MKNSILLILLLALVLGACAKGPSSKAKLKFSLGYQVAPLSVSKIRVLPVKEGSSTPDRVFDLNLGDPVLTIPVGNWTFYTVEWTGAAPYTGHMRCGASSLVEIKAGAEASVDITPSEENCGLPIFKTQFDNYCYEPSSATGTGAGYFRDGEGTIGNPYIVCSIDQLNSIGGNNFSTLSFNSKHFRLGKNLNFYGRFPTTASPTLMNDPAPFTMIGDIAVSAVTEFTGSFDGANHSISGLTIKFPNSTARTGVGFIRILKGTIKNIYFYMPEIDAKDTPIFKAGIVAGIADDQSGFYPILDNVHVFYGHVEGLSEIGGLVGSSMETTRYVKILNSSYREGEVSGVSKVGGLIGLKFMTGSEDIQNSFSTGEIHSREGYCSNTTYKDQSTCAANSGTWYSSESLGGIIGFLSSGSSATPTIVNSFSSMNIQGQAKIGGLVGSSTAGTLYIQDSYSTSNLYAYSSPAYVGGIIGYTSSGGSFTRVFHTQGSVASSSNNEVGAIIGFSSNTISCPSVNATLSAGLALNCTGSASLTYADMRSSSYYPSWTASGTWVFDDDGYDYPRLSWEPVRPCHGLFSGSFAGGSGSANDPYLICHRDQFYNINNDFSAHYALLSDVDLASSTVLSDAPLMSTTNTSTPFTGSLNGRFHSINSMVIEKSSNNMGLFKSIGAGGVVGNLAMEGAKLKFSNSAWSFAGAIAGQNAGTISRVAVRKGILYGGDYKTGGIVGENTGTVSLSESELEVYGRYYLGGLVGNNDGTISRSRSYSSVTATTTSSAVERVGGLAGRNAGLIEESQTSNYIFISNFTGTASSTGGFVGENLGTIRDSYANGKISTSSTVALNASGGFVGTNSGSINRVWVATPLSASGTVSTSEEFIGVNTSATTDFTDSYVMEVAGLGNWNTNTKSVTLIPSALPIEADYVAKGWSISSEDYLDEENAPAIWEMEVGKMPLLIRTNYNDNGRDYNFYKTLLGF